MKKALWLTSKKFSYLWLSDELFDGLRDANFISYDNYQKIWKIRPYDTQQRTLNVYIPKNRPFRATDFTVELENGESQPVISLDI
jgi:hypothetical protein|tara:strand:+ start:812 stop:1066 length:255 start_codon:yes stop_codon:yes gene_type:complete